MHSSNAQDKSDEMRDKLRKYDPIMERMFYILLVINVSYETLCTTSIIADIVTWFGSKMPGVSPDLVILMFQSLANIRLLIAIPAFYTVFALMKNGREKCIALIMLFLGWFYMFYMRKWSDTYIFTSMLLVVSSYGKDYKKIARCSIFSVGTVVILAVILSSFGMLQQYNLERDGRIRHSYGFTGPTGFAAHVCMIIMTLMFIRNGRLKWYDYFLIFSLTLFNVVLVDGRVAFIAMVLATGGCVVCSLYDRFLPDLPEKLLFVWRKLLCFSYVIIAGVFYFMVFTYRADGTALYQKIPVLGSFAGRIETPHRIMQVLPFSFFGNYMEKYSAAEHTFEQIGDYNFIDSSYARLYLIYGFVGLMIGLSLFTAIQWRLNKEKRLFGMFVLSVSAVFFIMQKGILDPGYNVFPMLLWAMLPNVQKTEKQSEQSRISI